MAVAIERIFTRRTAPVKSTDEGRAVARHRAPDSFQTVEGGVENLAAIERTKSVAESRDF
jgi:hypothetical protein